MNFLLDKDKYLDIYMKRGKNILIWVLKIRVDGNIKFF